MKTYIIKYIFADVSPPEFIRCPSDIRANIDGNSTALVNWTKPIAHDNSNVGLNITVIPSGISPPHAFNETTLVSYTATDANGNTNDCSFKVILEGKPTKVFIKVKQEMAWLKVPVTVNIIEHWIRLYTYKNLYCSYWVEEMNLSLTNRDIFIVN